MQGACWQAQLLACTAMSGKQAAHLVVVLIQLMPSLLHDMQEGKQLPKLLHLSWYSGQAACGIMYLPHG